MEAAASIGIKKFRQIKKRERERPFYGSKRIRDNPDNREQLCV